MREELSLHFLNGDALCVSSNVQRRYYLAAGALNGHRHRSQAVLEFLVDDRETLAAHLPENLRKFRGADDRALGVSLELCAPQVRLKFFRS